MATKHVPDGYHTATPYLIMDDAARAIDFYKRAFGATELMRYDAPGGKIGHAEIRVGDSFIMLADVVPCGASVQAVCYRPRQGLRFAPTADGQVAAPACGATLERASRPAAHRRTV